jgi:hypothetical protein
MDIADLIHNSPLEISLNMKLRYGPVVAILNRLKANNKNISILEVGSGSKGITRFFKYPVTGLDVSFQKYKNHLLKEVKLNPSKKYPFKDKEFDVVISVDTIEHIPKKLRNKALMEIKRVSKKYVILTCPFEISKWDKRVLSDWPKSSSTYKNIKEHYDCGIPSRDEIKNAFKGCKIRCKLGSHPAIAYYIKLIERSYIGKLFARTLLKITLPLLKQIKSRSRLIYYIEKY